jgi:serine/threonine protein kinase
MQERRTLGRFVCGQRVATGPLGALHRARVYGDAGFEKDFALLVVDEEVARDRGALGRLVRAANAWARLSHPSIARAHELAAEGDVHYLVSDWVRGATLGALLGDGPLPLEAALLVALDVADAVAHAHSRADLVPGGILHLGLSPETILVDGEGRVVVRDFGLLHARVASDWADDDQLVYWLRYCAPELHAARPVDGRADVFSLGAVLFELLAGRPAFAGARARSIVAQADVSPPSLTGIPPAAGPLLARALAARAAGRLPSLAELRLQVESLLGDRASAARQLLAARAHGKLPPEAARAPSGHDLPGPPPPTGLRAPSLADDFFAALPDVTERVHRLPAPPSMLGSPANWGGRPLLPPPTLTVWDPPSTTATTTLDALRRQHAVRRPRTIATVALMLLALVAGGLGWARLARLRPSVLGPVEPLPPQLQTSPPVPPPTATTTMAPTRVTSTPPGAPLFVDGVAAGVTPAALPLPAGAHTLVLAAEGYRLWHGVIDAGTTVAAQLVPAQLPATVAGTAGLKLSCKHAGQWRVLIDGADSGRGCPVEERIELRHGWHRITLYAPSGDRTVPIERPILVKNRGASTHIVLEEP